MTIIYNATQKITYDDKDHPHCTSYMLKMVFSRHDFFSKSKNLVDVDNEILHQVITDGHNNSDHYDLYVELCDILERSIKEIFLPVSDDVVVYDGIKCDNNNSKFSCLFPTGNVFRQFFILVNFEDNNHINRMKLKHPRIMDFVTGKSDDL